MQNCVGSAEMLSHPHAKPRWKDGISRIWSPTSGAPSHPCPCRHTNINIHTHIIHIHTYLYHTHTSHSGRTDNNFLFASSITLYSSGTWITECPDWLLTMLCLVLNGIYGFWTIFMPHHVVLSLFFFIVLNSRDLDKLRRYDELRREIRDRKSFDEFVEPVGDFIPTYKLKPDRYRHRRTMLLFSISLVLMNVPCVCVCVCVIFCHFVSDVSLMWRIQHGFIVSIVCTTANAGTRAVVRKYECQALPIESS